MADASASSPYLDQTVRGPITIAEDDYGPASVHIIDQPSIDAVDAALAIGRPLLVKGEPGTGKSQLARAVAAHKRWSFRAHAVDATTETHDLQWRLDAVRRLAEAQLLGSLTRAGGKATAVSEAKLREQLDLERFIEPGILWWAFDRAGFERQRATYERRAAIVAPDGQPVGQRSVVLIDEIDKADGSVPNGLLDALGNGRFEVPGMAPVEMNRAAPPLIIITTNKERELPPAFERRCLVLQLELPADGLAEFLVERGEAHFAGCDKELLKKAAANLIADREAHLANREARGVPPPGLAEYIDMVGIAMARKTDTPRQRLARLEAVRPFTSQKRKEPSKERVPR